MTDHPRLEVPFDVVTKWEEIEGSCARFYAAAEWGYKQALATPPPEPPTDEEIEEAAILIHASMRFAVPDNHYTRDWVERGNSLMHDEARRTARAVLERWGRA